MDRLIERIAQLWSPVALRLDADLQIIPKSIYQAEFESRWKTPAAMRESIVRYNKLIIDTVYDLIPAVIIPSKVYAIYGLEGMAAAEDTINYANQNGLITINDSELTSITVNSSECTEKMIGNIPIDDLFQEIHHENMFTVHATVPLHHLAPISRALNKQFFVTANECNNSFYETILHDPQLPLYMYICNAIDDSCSGTINPMGDHGYRDIGVSVSFRHHIQLSTLRRRHPSLFFLVDGNNKLPETLAGFGDTKNGALVDLVNPIMTCHTNSSYAGMTLKDAIR